MLKSTGYEEWFTAAYWRPCLLPLRYPFIALNKLSVTQVIFTYFIYTYIPLCCADESTKDSSFVPSDSTVRRLSISLPYFMFGRALSWGNAFAVCIVHCSLVYQFEHSGKVQRAWFKFGFENFYSSLLSGSASFLCAALMSPQRTKQYCPQIEYIIIYIYIYYNDETIDWTILYWIWNYYHNRKMRKHLHVYHVTFGAESYLSVCWLWHYCVT